MWDSQTNQTTDSDLSISSWDTLLPTVSHHEEGSNEDETSSFQSTQINVFENELTNSPNEEEGSEVDSTLDTKAIVTMDTVLENSLETTLADSTFDTSMGEVHNNMSEDINSGSDSSSENTIDKYHNFLQSELGLYHDNLAHEEDVDYLVWVLEKYGEYNMSKE